MGMRTTSCENSLYYGFNKDTLLYVPLWDNIEDLLLAILMSLIQQVQTAYKI